MSAWSTASIRLRMTSWYTAVLTLMLVVYAAATFFAVRHEFLEQLDGQLHDDFETAERFMTPAPDGRITWSGDQYRDPDADDDHGSDVWLPGGDQIARSGASDALPPVALATANAQAHYESMAGGGRRWRTLTGTVLVAGRSVVLRVSRSEERLRGQLREVLIVLVLGLPLVVVLAGAGGYLLARRALQPIDRLATEAQRITAERLHERVSVPNSSDEIGRLGGVMNDAFARLEASFDRLRRFTADASHELRTPLAVVRSIGESGLAETRTPAEYKETIGSMLEEVDRLTTLVDTLLRLSHADAGSVHLSRAPFDLGRLAHEVAASLSVLAEERGQRIAIDATDGVLVTADRMVVREAVTNVIDNAIKYSPMGTIVAVSVRAAGDASVLDVSDRGPGIADEYRDRIFDRFFRIDASRSRDAGGTGLGLAIARWAVEVNGGSITVDAAAGGGAVFRIAFSKGSA